MEEILVCRLCLSTNVKLFNMYKYRLATAYENLTGFEMTPQDSVQHACSMCSALLQKSAAFQQTCRNSQDLLKFAMMQQHKITTEYIESLKLPFPYSNIMIKHIDRTIEFTHFGEKDVKQELNWDSDDNVKVKEVDTSDEEPLSTKVVKKANIKSNANNDKPKTKSNKNNDDEFESKNDFNDDFDYNDGASDIVVKTEGGNDNDELDNDFRDGEVDIIVLTKEQQIEEVQARKSSLNYLNSFYKCDYCFKGFITDTTYKNHMDRHDPRTGSHSCDVCHTRWASARSLRAHLATSHERKFVCKLCHYVSKSRHRAKEHSKWHAGHLFVCKFCGATFSKSTSHLTHVRLRHPSKHACEICGETFIGQNGLNMHKKKAHRNKKIPELSAESRCVHCNVQFKDVIVLKHHLGVNEKCDLSIRACRQCGDGFNSDEELKEHMKMHSKDEEVRCEECSRTFAHARSYAVHFQRAHAARPAARAPAVCEVCGTRCISNATLRYHQRIHTGERPYQCTECPKRFSVYQRLQIHHRTHSGERPYKCSHCPKAFKHKAALNRHDRVHTGAKPYSCSHCGKAFSQSNSMKLHIRTVHLKMPSPYRARRLPAE